MKYTPIFRESFGYEKNVESVDINLDGLGNVYAFSNPLDMPYERYCKFLDFNNEIEFGSSREFIIESLDKIIAAANSGRVADIGMLTYLLKDSLSVTASEHFYKIASVIFLIEGESPFDYDHDLGQEKIKAFKELKAKKKILWDRMSSLYPNLSRSSLTDIEVYLKRNDKILATYRKVLTDTRSY
jgi:hypothetical protein